MNAFIECIQVNEFIPALAQNENKIMQTTKKCVPDRQTNRKQYPLFTGDNQSLKLHNDSVGALFVGNSYQNTRPT